MYQEEYSYETKRDAYRAAIAEAEMRARLAYKPARKFDAGKTPIEDAPLFGGPRQASMFISDLDTIDERHDDHGGRF